MRVRHVWPHPARDAALSVVVLVITLGAANAATSRVDGFYVEGPFGSGADQVWVVRPSAAIRSVVVFGHGWKVFPPSPAHPWVGQFRPWLEHLAHLGSAVIFPRYQIGNSDDQGPARVDAYRRGLALGFARIGHPRVPVIAIGYSYGASLAFTYAADAHSWQLPQPRALDCIFPAGLLSGVPLAPLPSVVRVLIQVGDRDTEAGSGGANAFWNLLRAHPARRRRYEIVASAGGFTADHAAPKRSDPPAQRAFWRPLDALVAKARVEATP